MPKSYAYDEVVSYCAANENNWRKLAIAIELEVVNARDKEAVPIYLTKMRVKKAPSAYLKTKRKPKDSLSQITDWIGLRVLCLFQQDIAPVHRCLLRLFLGSPGLGLGETSIKEVIAFNWKASDAEHDIEKAIRDSLKRNDIKFASGDSSEYGHRFIYTFKNSTKSHVMTYKVEERGSGYKSIHYNVEVGGTTIEIQLRTLLQDVWGELEHALSYKKGKIHPHITNSFQLLARELEAKDILLRQLREVSEKAKNFSLYASIKSGPNKWLTYESSFLKKLPRTPAFTRFLKEYFRNFTPEKNNRWTRDSEWCERVSNTLNKGVKIVGKITPHTRFFFDMERAFIAFCQGNIPEAEKIYQEYATKSGYRDRWVVHLRLGEIYNVRGQTEEALVKFDHCEALLSKLGKDDRDLLAEYFAKQKLANVYWSLGEEYTDIAIEKILEADEIFGSLKGSTRVGTGDEMSLLNNLCYFVLERHVQHLAKKGSVEAEFDAANKAESRYEALKAFVADNPKYASSNVYDTLAWYAYQKYKVLKMNGGDAIDWIKNAYGFMEAAEGKPNASSASPLTSVALQYEHLQEIMTAYNEEIRGSHPSLL